MVLFRYNSKLKILQGILLRMIRLVATVSGQVQGVFYRAYVQDAATELGLVGTVQNKSDGTVLVVAEGAPETLKELVEYLHEGSLQAQVVSVAIEWGNARGTFSEFSVLQ